MVGVQVQEPPDDYLRESHGAHLHKVLPVMLWPDLCGSCTMERWCPPWRVQNLHQVDGALYKLA